MIGIRMKADALKRIEENSGLPILCNALDLYVRDKEGNEIPIGNSVRGCFISIPVDDVVTATLEVYLSEVTVDGMVTQLAAKDYQTGQLKSVKRIIFEDGSVLESGR